MSPSRGDGRKITAFLSNCKALMLVFSCDIVVLQLFAQVSVPILHILPYFCMYVYCASMFIRLYLPISGWWEFNDFFNVITNKNIKVIQ